MCLLLLYDLAVTIFIKSAGLLSDSQCTHSADFQSGGSKTSGDEFMSIAAIPGTAVNRILVRPSRPRGELTPLFTM